MTRSFCTGWLVLAGVLGFGLSASGQAAPARGGGTAGPSTAVGASAPTFAQDDKGNGGTATAVADGDALGHGFEVATVKPANENDQRMWWGYQVAPSGRFMVSAMALNGLVWYAYVGEQKMQRVEGGPKWVDTDEWDIEAKLDEADMAGWDKLSDRERIERVRPQLRALLVERFGLKMHTEMKVTPVYALVQAKGGVKMKEVAAPPANMDAQEQEELRSNKASDGLPPGVFSNSGNGMVGHAVTVSQLVGQIGDEMGATDKLMVDETGLDGHYYDFSIKLSKDKDGPTVEQQIEDQMGLRVEEHKVSMKTYVIDAAAKPGEN
jgi:uncharacterized protein (TIGR03435 family)